MEVIINIKNYDNTAVRFKPDPRWFDMAKNDLGKDIEFSNIDSLVEYIKSNLKLQDSEYKYIFIIDNDILISKCGNIDMNQFTWRRYTFTDFNTAN